MSEFACDRKFQFWEYNVSHGSLLIRSPRGPDHSNNVDIKFFGVVYVDLPRHMAGLLIRELGASEEAGIKERLGLADREGRVFELKIGSYLHHVVAVQMSVGESTLEIFESPFQ